MEESGHPRLPWTQKIFLVQVVTFRHGYIFIIKD
jgi:hypothetical protein